MRRRSSCRRRTKSTVDLIWFWTMEFFCGNLRLLTVSVEVCCNGSVHIWLVGASMSELDQWHQLWHWLFEVYLRDRFSVPFSSCYTKPICRCCLTVNGHGLYSHLYADDTQIYGSCKPNASLKLRSMISNCADDVANWMRSNRLQLNTAKTEILWSTSGRRVRQLPQLPLQVCRLLLLVAFGIHIDADVSMRSHITKTVSGCFAVLHQLHSIRRSVPRSVLQSLVTSLVLSRLDYGNDIHAGIPSYLVKASVCDECGCLAGVFIVEVWSHHPAPLSTA